MQYKKVWFCVISYSVMKYLPRQTDLSVTLFINVNFGFIDQKNVVELGMIVVF